MKKIIKEQSEEEMPQGVTDPEAVSYYPELQQWQKVGVSYAAPSERNALVKKYKQNNDSFFGKASQKASGAADIAMTPLTKWMPKLHGVQSVDDKQISKIITDAKIPLPSRIDYLVLQAILSPNEKEMKQLLIKNGIIEEENGKIFINGQFVKNLPYQYYNKVAQLLSKKIAEQMKFTSNPSVTYAITQNQQFKNNVYSILKKYEYQDISKYTKSAQREYLKKALIDSIIEYVKEVTDMKKQLPSEKFNAIINYKYSLLQDASTIAPPLKVNPSSSSAAATTKDMSSDQNIKDAFKSVMSAGSEFQYDRTKSTAPNTPKATTPSEDEKVAKDITLQTMFKPGGGGMFDPKAAQAEIEKIKKERGISDIGGFAPVIIGGGGTEDSEVVNTGEGGDFEALKKKFEQMAPEEKKGWLSRLFGK